MESTMTHSSDGKQKLNNRAAKNSESVKPFNPAYLDLDQKCFISPVNGQPVSVEEASDEEFDQFIRQYVELGWTLEERVNALIDAMEDGQKIEFCQLKKLGGTQEPTQFFEAIKRREKPRDGDDIA